MSYPRRRKVTEQVLIQLVEADVDIGFGLVDEARAYLASGQPEFSARALQEASAIVLDIQRRLEQLVASDSAPFLPLLGELSNQIAAVTEGVSGPQT